MGITGDLSENEGMLLGLVVRLGSTTAHQLFVMFEDSPLGSLNASKGSVYPIVRRLKARGLLFGEPVVDDRRNAEMLSATPAGVEAMRNWVAGITVDHSLTIDPLRTRVMSLNLLSRDEQIQWVVDAKRANKAKLDQVREYQQRVKMAFGDIVHGAALGALAAQAKWLDDLLYLIVEGGAQGQDLQFLAHGASNE